MEIVILIGLIILAGLMIFCIVSFYTLKTYINSHLAELNQRSRGPAGPKGDRGEGCEDCANYMPTPTVYNGYIGQYEKIPTQTKRGRGEYKDGKRKRL